MEVMVAQALEEKNLFLKAHLMEGMVEKEEIFILLLKQMEDLI